MQIINYNGAGEGGGRSATGGLLVESGATVVSPVVSLMMGVGWLGRIVEMKAGGASLMSTEWN